jgi:hypothetical protein
VSTRSEKTQAEEINRQQRESKEKPPLRNTGIPEQRSREISA